MSDRWAFAVTALTLFLLATAPASAAPLQWVQSPLPANGENVPTLVACPSAGMCVAADDLGDIWSTAQPAFGGQAWTRTYLDVRTGPNNTNTTGWVALSCPSARMCVADGDTLAISRNPSAGASSWRYSFNRLDNGPGGLACPTTRLCVRPLGPFPTLMSTTRPTVNGDRWRSNPVPNVATWEDISCPSERFCAAVAYLGEVVTSTRPGSRKPGWRLKEVLPADPGRNSILAISCPSRKLCVALTGGGAVLTSRRPRGGRSAWHSVRVLPRGRSRFGGDMECPSVRRCVLIEPRSGALWESSKPTGAATGWRRSSLPGHFIAVSCPSAKLCVAVGADGDQPVVAVGTA